MEMNSTRQEAGFTEKIRIITRSAGFAVGN